MEASNVLLILSDEHNPRIMGCAGHPEIHTPHLDALAATGTRFTNAICASPVCVPTRAALATGRPVYETGYWDNVDAFDGRVPTWHHLLRDQGMEVSSIGKLHYRGWEGDDYGFTESLNAMHIHEGRGELKMLLRDPPASLGDGSNMLRSAKAGVSDYIEYDRRTVAMAESWLQQHGDRPKSESVRPWVLMVSLVAPHFPLTVPDEFFNLYAGRPLQLPKGYQFGVDPAAHPYIRQYAEQSGYNLHFKSEADVRRALAGYYGLVSFLDANVGRLRKALHDSGLADSTRIVYLSDHGDNTGTRGLWGKSTMYAESVGVPLIINGPGVAPGRIEHAAVNHTDIFNTVVDAVGLPLTLSTACEDSSSLLRPLDPERSVVSEYHAFGSKSGIFMIQDASEKYVHYVDHPPQLFDLRNDPEELHDLGMSPAHAGRVQYWRERLHKRFDPVQVDRAAKQRQGELVEFYGGETAIRKSTPIGGYTPAPNPSAGPDVTASRATS